MAARNSQSVKQSADYKAEEDEILKELCNNNGINQAKLDEEGPQCRELEMFFSGMPHMIGLYNFPNLQKLVIIGQAIELINGLDALSKLQELWIAECALMKIEGLNRNSSLRRLFLYDNQISVIENLESLKDLEVLWLNDNEISIIEGLSHMKYLQELNLASNYIEKVGNSLSCHQYLHTLELSGNYLSSFKDITNLGKLPKLKHLGLKNAMYPPNPACLLCNYSTHILYHLPILQTLDGHDVSSKSLRELAETTVIKKKMYYNMKVKTIRRNLTEVSMKLEESKKDLEAAPEEKIRKLMSAYKEIERELNEVEADSGAYENESNTEKDVKEEKTNEDHTFIYGLKKKQKAIMGRIGKWEKKLEEITEYYKEIMNFLKSKTENVVQSLELELETGGNIRFEDGTSADPWFSSCHDLILSRFCASDYKDHGIVGIKIHRITRVYNRALRTRFEDALSAKLDDDDAYMPGSRSSTFKKFLEYLFWVWDPELPGGQREVDKVLEEGFTDGETSKKLGKDEAVHLTNSLSLADRFRIKSCVKHSRETQNLYADRCPFRHGQLVISKVYIGKSVQCHDHNLIETCRFPKVDSVYRPKKYMTQESSGKSSLVSSITEHGQTSCECNNRQCDWFVFNNHLAMPEYLVDFEYVTRARPRNPFMASPVGVLETQVKQSFSLLDGLSGDEEILTMEPHVKPRPRLVALNDDLIMKTANVSTLSQIRVLNLHGNGLTKVKHLQNLPVLKKVIISFNEITRLDDLASTNLEYLDVSFNKIYSLDGLRNMNKLKYLDLSWNKLYQTREDISILRKHCPNLTSLDLRRNHWQKADGLRLRTIGRIKSLTMLNGLKVTEAESTEALRMAAGSRVSQVSLLTHARTDASRPRTLCLVTYAKVLLHTSKNRPDRTSEHDSLWYSKVTTLNLDGQHISKLSNLERLENLRWLSFCDNDITKIEGLETCTNLEELSLENNCITKLENISKLTKLRRLNLGHNYITSLEGAGLERLTQLHHLSVEKNRINSLSGLQRVPSLIEIYAANNEFDNVREVFYLKSLPNLLILDLHGSPVVFSTENYRLFVIYHLKSLKALDGQSIELNELNQAKDTFGGRLTQDFVAERLGVSNFSDLRELDFPNCSIRTVDLGTGHSFLNLRSVNLEHNNLTSLSGLVQLVNLRVLCLNYNHVECIVPRPKQPPPSIKSKVGSLPTSNGSGSSLVNPESYTPILENLEVLHLGYNGIKDMSVLQLSRLVSLKALFLQGNEITKIEGLEGLQDLRELVIDRNKIKNIDEYSFLNQWNLQELHAEENRIKELGNLCHLESLQRLYLGNNRIQDIGEIERLDCLNGLLEVSLVSNAVARRLMHRPLLVYRIPSLQVIDGIAVTDEERAKAELYFMEQQPPQITTTVETTLPGIGQYKSQIPVKVTNMQLVSPHLYDSTWGGTIHYAENVLQQELQRAAARQKKNNSKESSHSAVNMNVNNAQRVGGSTFNFQHAPALSGGIMLSYQHASSTREQHQLSHIPYVPHQPPSYGEHFDNTNRKGNTNK